MNLTQIGWTQFWQVTLLAAIISIKNLSQFRVIHENEFLIHADPIRVELRGATMPIIDEDGITIESDQIHFKLTDDGIDFTFNSAVQIDSSGTKMTAEAGELKYVSAGQTSGKKGSTSLSLRGSVHCIADEEIKLSADSLELNQSRWSLEGNAMIEATIENRTPKQISGHRIEMSVYFPAFIVQQAASPLDPAGDRGGDGPTTTLNVTR